MLHEQIDDLLVSGRWNTQKEMGEDRAFRAAEGWLCLSADGPSSCQVSSLSRWCQQQPLLAFRAACGRSAGYPAYGASLVVSLPQPQLCKQPPLKLLSTRACVRVYYHSCHGNQISSPRLSHSFTVIQITFFSPSFFTDTV